MTRKLSRDTATDRAFYSINAVFLCLFLIVIVYPLVYILSSSFSSTDAVMAGKVWLLPADPSVRGYQEIFGNRYILTGYYNTVLYTVCGTALNVTLTIMAAYPLSRKKLRFKGVLMFVFVFTMLFNGGLIPTYMLVQRLGIINTRWAMILPGAVSAFNVIIARTFYQSTIPESLVESAKIEGASDVRIMTSIVLPLSGAITGVLTIFYAVWHWNAFFSAFLYLSRRELYPLQIILREILILNSIDLAMMSFEEFESKRGMAELLKYSLIVVATGPILCIYPFAQKYFVRGVMIGAVKG
jgi:putative aldouronate transport system permease protein